MNCAASDIHNFTIAHNMKLNPTKFREMFVNFLHNRNVLVNPIITRNNVIEQVICYKILGFILSNDLKWNSHVDYIVEKSCKKLYSPRVLRRAGVSKANILKVYLTTIRPVLEYAVPVWQSIPDYLADVIKAVQKWHSR